MRSGCLYIGSRGTLHPVVASIRRLTYTYKLKKMNKKDVKTADKQSLILNEMSNEEIYHWRGNTE